jgi:hypothetical protein
VRTAGLGSARQERVSLPAMSRSGTATSALLSIFDSIFDSIWYTVFRLAGNVKLAERTPPGIEVPAVPVVRSRVGESDTAFGAEAGAIFPA